MVVCNVDRFLAAAIESILRQTFTEFEFIIVDFGSMDNSKSIVTRYADSDSRIKFHEIRHSGLAEARNAACSLAQGRYIALMDADDIAVETRLMLQVEFMEKHPEVGVLGGLVEWIDARGQSLLTTRQPLANREIQSALPKENPLWQPTVLLRNEAFRSVGGYRSVFTQSEDYDLWLRIAERFEIANLNQVMLRYRIHPDQVTLRKRREQVFCAMAAQAAARSRRDGKQDLLNSAKEITPALLATLGLSEVTQRRTLARGYLTWIRAMWATGQYSNALNAAIEILHSSDRQYAERWVITEVRFLVARIYWRQKKFLRSIMTAGHAVMARPIVLGRPLKPLLRRLGLIHGRVTELP
jgi:glycosyltransferase involved in cell wall biosynthesis